jgi:two-component system, sensor histidine kinase
MGTSEGEMGGSDQHFMTNDGWEAPSDMLLRQLQDRVQALEDELAALRQTAEENRRLELSNEQLRDANENLVLATVNAQTLRDEAEAANRRQNEFLAMLAHELRNPLAPISMAAALLQRLPDGPPQLASLQTIISRQVGHMARLLDDLLDAARINNGKITLTIEPILLSYVIEETMETVQPRINERGQRITVDLPPEPLVIDGDGVRLMQVFANLIGNASKYTQDRGEITVRAALTGDDVTVTIEDNGGGIAPEVLPHIFELFTQGPRSLARSEGGLGIGLNVVRNLVERHGGTVEGKSRGTGTGSTFIVRLPVSKKAEKRAPPEPPVQRVRNGCSILIIEDNLDACNTLKAFLDLEGHAVTATHDGANGLAAALSQEYDVLICDIGLPGLDGFDVIRQLRKSAHGATMFAVALSGYGQAEDRTSAIEAGFDHYCVKPVSPSALVSLIALKRPDSGGPKV